MKVASVSEIKNLDKRAAMDFGIDEILLMENAGNAVSFVIQKELGVKEKKFLILSGSGNNGGDGMVVARKIYSNGGEVKLLLLSGVEKLKGITKKNFEIIQKIGIHIEENPTSEEIKKAIQESDGIVDAMLGTGLKGEVEGLYRDAIQLLNDSGKPVLSVDIPSGINGDTGEVMGAAVRSRWTVTFGLPKIGNINYPGFEFCGKIFVSHISFPPELYDNDSLKVSINEPLPLKKREKDTHKGSFGETLFIAGSKKYLGAPYFSALSFLKAGGGLSYLATPQSIAPFIANKGSEIVLLPQLETDSGSISRRNLEVLVEFSKKVDFVVLGPGLSLDPETQKLVRSLAKEIKEPLLIDGDGLTALKDHLDIIKNRDYPTILTPHPGEFRRLFGNEMEELKRNKVDIVKSKAKEYNCILVLKGAHSLIGYPDGQVFINLTGNPGMATAGSGDVLTGTIAALFKIVSSENEKIALRNAVRMGVLIHGLAGDLISQEIGEDGVTAEDILKTLPMAMEKLRKDHTNIIQNISII